MYQPITKKNSYHCEKPGGRRGNPYALLSMTIILFLFTSPVHADITTGLMLWLKFNEGSGSTTNDSSGNGNTGTLVSSPSWVTGKMGDALLYNGTNNYVSVPYSSSIAPGHITISAWLKLTSLTTNTYSGGATANEMYPFGKANSGGNNDAYVLYKSSTQHLSFSINSYTNSVVSTTILSAGIWYFFTGTYDGSNIKIYINGYLDGTTAYSGGNITYDNTALLIGRRYTGSTYNAYFNGNVDDFRIYNRALTAADVAQLYASHTHQLSHAHLAGFHSSYN